MMTKAWRSARAWLARIMQRRIVRYALATFVLVSVTACYFDRRACIADAAIEELQALPSVLLPRTYDDRFPRLNQFLPVGIRQRLIGLLYRQECDVFVRDVDLHQHLTPADIESILRLVEETRLDVNGFYFESRTFPLDAIRVVVDTTHANFVSIKATETDLSVEMLRSLQPLPVADLALRADSFSDNMVSELPAEISYLNVAETALTDSGLEQLSRCKNLKLLDVHGTAVTDEAAIAFVKAVPSCKIWFGDLPSGHAETGTSLTWYRTKAAVQRQSRIVPCFCW